MWKKWQKSDPFPTVLPEDDLVRDLVITMAAEVKEQIPIVQLETWLDLGFKLL